MLRLLVLFALTLIFPRFTQAQTVAPAEPAPVAPAVAPPNAVPVQLPAPSAPTPAAPYYGHSYAAPPLVDPGRIRALNELQTLDQRIASVRSKQKQYSIVGPSVMTASGYGVSLAFGIVAMLQWALAEDIEEGHCGDYRYDHSHAYCDVNDDGIVDKDDEHTARSLARTFGVISGIGAGLGIAGTVLLVKRLSKRHEFAPELRDLGVRRGQLLQQLRYGGGYSRNSVQFNVTALF
jgi:hypothetical protein